MPTTYTFEKSCDVYYVTSDFLKKNTFLEKEISDYFLIYQSLQDLIPQTLKTLFSGNIFPLEEAWQDLQISFNLCCQGFYKQSMATLRNVFELSLVSIYMNIADEGHIDIKEWITSQKDTPSLSTLWNKISKHDNFKQIQQSYDLKNRILKLNDLHNFVHTKGYKYSNYMGEKLKSNCQTFEEQAFTNWITVMKEVVILSVICHLVKYPLGIIEYDYSKKFGIDIPAIGVLQKHILYQIRELIGKKVIRAIEKIAKHDLHVKHIMNYVNDISDMEDKDIENQIVQMNMSEIECIGLDLWLQNYEALYSNISLNAKELEIKAYLIAWAKENNYIEHGMIRQLVEIQEWKEKGLSLQAIKRKLGDKAFGNIDEMYENPIEIISSLKKGMQEALKRK